MRVKYVKYSRRHLQEQAEVSIEVDEEAGETAPEALQRARKIVNDHLGIDKPLGATIGERLQVSERPKPLRPSVMEGQ